MSWQWSFLFTSATVPSHHRPQGSHLLLTSCFNDPYFRVEKKASYPVTSVQAQRREWWVEPSTPWGSTAWHISLLLFQLFGYSPKPKGVFHRGPRITGLNVNSSEVKGLGRWLKLSITHPPLDWPTSWTLLPPTCFSHSVPKDWILLTNFSLFGFHIFIWTPTVQHMRKLN